VERTAAKQIAEHLESAIAHMSSSLATASQHMSAQEFAAFQKTVGISIGKLSHEGLDPIYAQHPDLAPPGVL
jgi:hypothetical protein